MPGSDYKNGGGKDSNSSDIRLWKEYTKGVDAFEDQEWKELDDMESSENSARVYTSQTDPVPEKPPAKTMNPQGSKELDGKTDERFRKGHLPIEATLDLHGMTQTQAQPALAHFLQNAQAKNQRCVLVITGKGGQKDKQEDRGWWEPKPGVLREQVPNWLSQKPLSDIVVKHYPAQPKDGGSGALYVYLRRKRS